MEILSIHEPQCAKKLKMEDGSGSSAGMGQYASQQQQQLPQPGTSDSFSDMIFQQQQQQQPYASMEEDIKPEIHLNDFPMADNDDHGSGGGSNNGQQQQNYAVSCSLETFDASSPHQGNFLAKAPLGFTYLDLDNRCIAL